MSDKKNIFGLTLHDLIEEISVLKIPKYVASQIANWMYKNGIVNFDLMSNISKRNQELLKEHFFIEILQPQKKFESKDGTIKFLFKVNETNYIETAYIPDKDKATLCVSTQVGCKMKCSFCATGKQGFQQNLSSGQIISQYQSIINNYPINNIVFMGMGEPLDNIDEVLKSLDVFTGEYSYNISSKKITVSTIGLIPELKKFLYESDCNIAISMHSPFNEERKEIMPIQIKYKIKDVIDTIINNNTKKNRKVSFEYIVFGNKNDTPNHVKEIARLLNNLKCRINLIRFHPNEGSNLPETNENMLINFQNQLKLKGFIATIRTTRGLDINAACGLLSTKEMLINT